MANREDAAGVQGGGVQGAAWRMKVCLRQLVWFTAWRGIHFQNRDIEGSTSRLGRIGGYNWKMSDCTPVPGQKPRPSRRSLRSLLRNAAISVALSKTPRAPVSPVLSGGKGKDTEKCQIFDAPLSKRQGKGEAFGVNIPQEPLMRAGAKPENKRWRSKIKAAAKSKFPC